jgi:hypothetical protein
MIEQLIDLFDAAVTAPVTTKHGLAILGPDGPMKRTQTGQYTPIAVDNEAPWSYWRIGDIKSTPYDIYACSMGALQQVPLRLVMLLPNDCGHRDILLAAGRAVSATTGAAKELLGAARVRVVGQRIAVDGVGQAEKISDIPLQWSLIAIDMDLEVIGTADCLVGCDEGPSVLCSVIATATNAEVVECLGDRINEICESDPCDPVTVASSDGEYSEVVPCGDSLILPDVTNTDSDGTPVTLPAQTPFVATPCGTPDPGYAQPQDSAGADIATLTTIPSGSTVNVPIGDGSVQLEDTAGNPLGSPVAVKAEETLVPVVAPNGTVMTSNGGDSVMDVLSGETKPLPKSKILFKDASDTSVFTDPYDNKFDGNLFPAIAIPRRELKDSNGDGIGIYASLDGLIDDTIPDIPDSAVTVNGTAFGSVKATSSLDVPVKDTLGASVGSKVGTEWIVPAASTGDYDVDAYIASVQQADNAALEIAVKTLLYNFITGLKSDGLWTAMKNTIPLVGARTLAGALVPLSGPSPTNFNFVDADYNRKTGLKGNGSTKYLLSGRNNNASPQNNTHNYVYITAEDTSMTSTAYMGAGVADNGSNLLGKSGSAPYNAVVRSRSSTAFTAATSGPGGLGITRNNGANYTLRIAGADQTVTQASQTPYDGLMGIFARVAGGTPTIYTNGRIAFASQGLSLTLSQLDARVATYMSALSAAIP